MAENDLQIEIISTDSDSSDELPARAEDENPITEESNPVVVTDKATTSQAGVANSSNPWPYLEEFFQFLGPKDENRLKHIETTKFSTTS